MARTEPDFNVRDRAHEAIAISSFMHVLSSRTRSVAIAGALAVLAVAISPSFAQYRPITAGVSPGGQVMFQAVTDAELLETLSMGEYLLIVCKQVPLPRMTAQVVFLREEAIMRLGLHASEAVVLAVKQHLAQNPHINTAMCVDSPSVEI